MKLHSSILFSMLAGCLMTGPVLAGNGWGGQKTQGDNAPINQTLTAALPVAAADTLLFMREEEKLARDLYLEMATLWSAQLFDNIAASEQRHLEAIGGLLTTYGLVDPVAEDIPGVFVNAELQALYGSLVVQGQSTYSEALQVGALVEEVDIEDLLVALEEVENPDVVQVYENLLRGSRNHLRAFVGEIERLGEVYTAQHLDQEVVDAIVDSPMERGGDSGRRGRGNRR